MQRTRFVTGHAGSESALFVRLLVELFIYNVNIISGFSNGSRSKLLDHQNHFL